MKLGVELKRNIFHMLMGVLIVILLLLKIIGKMHIFFLIVVAISIAFLKKKHEIPPIDLALKHFERPKNLKTFPGKGVIFYLIGVFLTLSFFPLDIAMPAIMVLAFADPISHFFGTRFGKIAHPLTTKKFIEGMIAGMIAGFLGALIFVPWPQALAASFFAMIAEGIEMKIGPGRVDDNVIIPLVAAAAIWAIRFLASM
ncbi:MAG: hypothetical protein V1831_00185 [Candidatus Woesearchaeota archaeon]